MAKLKLNSTVKDIKGVGPKYLQIFEKYGIATVMDLLLHFPVFYIDFAKASTELVENQKNLYLAEVTVSGLSRYLRPKRYFSVLKVAATVGATPVSIVFFNKPYLLDMFKFSPKAYIYGEFEYEKNAWVSTNPVVFTEISREPVIPVYNNISTIKSGQIKKLIEFALYQLDDDFENLPPMCIGKYMFPGITDTLRAIHFPHYYIPDDVEKMKKRFAYTEFLFFQLELQFIRNLFKRVQRINNYRIIPEFESHVSKALGFDLTPDQKKACEEIIGELRGELAMQRLLQGDVGSGKTIVAFIALLIAAANQFQGAFLAPTEILASQHFTNAQKFFKSYKIALLTGSTPAKERKDILEGLLDGSISIVFGTHALLTERVHFKHLSMVVIDEQHRFGVSQRAALYYKGNSVDLLVTTATPIPRTMLLSIYNDLAVSTIKTKPEGRLPISTKIIDPDKRDSFYANLKKKIEEGEKAYIILPLIEKSEFFSELKDIESETSYYKEMFKGIPIGIVTGRMDAEEKDRTLKKLADGRIRILIATTVIEVGIDVKDATVIVIENADRYGLSQLHQLRGRVGRGTLPSSCILFPSPGITRNGKKRLQTIKETDDGFKIAETDLEMRGGGIITGLEQSGYLDFKVGDLKDDIELFKKSRNDAAILLEHQSLQNDYIKNFLAGLKEKLKDINFS